MSVGKYLSKPVKTTQQKRNLDFGEITQAQNNNATSNTRKKQKTYGDFSQFG